MSELKKLILFASCMLLMGWIINVVSSGQTPRKPVYQPSYYQCRDGYDYLDRITTVCH